MRSASWTSRWHAVTVACAVVAFWVLMPPRSCNRLGVNRSYISGTERLPQWHMDVSGDGSDAWKPAGRHVRQCGTQEAPQFHPKAGGPLWLQ